jgi:hypothetical protein
MEYRGDHATKPATSSASPPKLFFILYRDGCLPESAAGLMVPPSLTPRPFADCVEYMAAGCAIRRVKPHDAGDAHTNAVASARLRPEAQK